MTWLTLVIAMLAASRITRLITSDTITEPARRYLLIRHPGSDTLFGDSEVKGDGKDTYGRQVGTLRDSGVDVVKTKPGWIAVHPRFLGNVISCHWCTGIWVAVVVWAVVWFYPVTVPFLAALAVAEVIGLLNDR